MYLLHDDITVVALVFLYFSAILCMTIYFVFLFFSVFLDLTLSIVHFSSFLFLGQLRWPLAFTGSQPWSNLFIGE